MKTSRASLSARHAEMVAGYLYILPAVLLFLSFVLIPMFVSFGLSFTKYDLIGEPKFVALQNYQDLMTNSELLNTFKNTAVFSVFAILGNVGGGLLLGVFLNRSFNRFFQYFYRTAFFLPVVVSMVYVALIWFHLYATGTGVFNYFMESWGFQPIGWLSDGKYAMMSILVTDIWKNVGFYMVIFLAGMQTIPSMYYEVADLDGANALRKFRHITLPLITPTLFFCLIMVSINALQVFDAIYVMTQGGPAGATKSVVIFIYENGFKRFKIGYASAAAMMLFAVIGLLTFVQFRYSKKWVVYQS